MIINIRPRNGAETDTTRNYTARHITIEKKLIFLYTYTVADERSSIR